MANTKSDVMAYDKVLPEDFDGTFRFTNFSDEDFVGTWGSKEYVFPAETTSPMPAASLNATPLEVQYIRKKFAKDLAEREFQKGNQYKKLLTQERGSDGMPRVSGIHAAGTYSLDDLAPFIQQALKPLAVSKAMVKEAGLPPLEDKLSKDENGELNTIAVKKDGDLIEEKKSLRRKALG